MATVGYNETPEDVFSNVSNGIWVTKIVMPEDGAVVSLGAYVNIADEIWSQARLVIYSNNAGVPGTLLGSSAAIYEVPAAGMDDLVLPLLDPLELSEGVTYWVGAQLQHDSARWGVVGVSSTGGIKTVADRTGPDWNSGAPTTFTPDTQIDVYNLCTWIVYTEPGGGGEPNPGLRIKVVSTSGSSIENTTDVSVVAYDTFGGTELFQSSSESIVGSVIEIDSNSFGAIDDVVYINITKPGITPDLDFNACGRVTVVDLVTEDES